MDSFPSLLLLFLFAAGGVFLAVAGPASGGATLGLEFHHRFSDRMRQWAEARGGLPGSWWPEKGSVEYYAALARHDRARRGRALAGRGEDPDRELYFADGNQTNIYLGSLHYAVVALGTPNVTFLVALDTGSDLFWVPCNCKTCAPTSSPSYGNIMFDIYSPNKSSTSQKVPCNSSFCTLKSSCSAATSSCPYEVQYVSNNTSSSGVLVEDILYFKTKETIPKDVKAPIVFGCGETQTGAFLDGAAPNGLFGLGMDNVSVPSVLASNGYTSNSFSMCFGSDGVGRIYFGDKGSSDQKETPFDINQRHPTYNISLIGMEVGNSSIDVKFSAIVDSGTSFTALADPMYTKLSESFHARIQENRHASDSDTTFEYCYDLSPTQESVTLPVINLTTKGGNQFPVNVPIVTVSYKEGGSGYCLALLKSSRLNIIGQNFMAGLRIVFDRERLVLGWKEFNCYNDEDASTLPVNRNPSAVPPAAASGPSYNPEATKQGGNTTQVMVLSPSSTGHSSNLNSMRSIFLMLMVLLLAIL